MTKTDDANTSGGQDDGTSRGKNGFVTAQQQQSHQQSQNHDSGERTTLPRFPVPATDNKNCWSVPEIGGFRVRGLDYLSDHKKVASGPYLLETRGCDLYLTEGDTGKIAKYPSALGGMLRESATFLINFRFPWGILVLYFAIPDRFLPFLSVSSVPQPSSDGQRQKRTNGEAKSGSETDPKDLSATMERMSPAEQTLAQFFMADDTEKNHRLKLIPYITEGPWVARKLVTGRPAIIGNKLPVKYTYSPASADGSKAECLEADLDIGGSSTTAKRIVSVCKRYMNALTLDVGFVIQGNSMQELPEQMLGGVRVHSLDPQQAPHLK